jgi:hypothetical protein
MSCCCNCCCCGRRFAAGQLEDARPLLATAADMLAMQLGVSDAAAHWALCNPYPQLQQARCGWHRVPAHASAGPAADPCTARGILCWHTTPADHNAARLRWCSSVCMCAPHTAIHVFCHTSSAVCGVWYSLSYCSAPTLFTSLLLLMLGCRTPVWLSRCTT